MPIIGLSVTKSVSFRLSVQEFSNVYYYNNGIGTVPDAAAAEALLDEVVNFEKSIHCGPVSFVFGRVWHQGLTALLSDMIFQKALSGTGSQVARAEMDRERAYLIRWRAGTDSRGNPVYLRKWYHTLGGFGATIPNTTVTGAIQEQTGGFTSANRTAIADKAKEVYNIGGSPGPWDLCAKSGRGSSVGNNPDAHQFLEHHQLGDQWRAS